MCCSEVTGQAALDIFENHWILYATREGLAHAGKQRFVDLLANLQSEFQVMDTILWEGHRQKNVMDAMEHQSLGT